MPPSHYTRRSALRLGGLGILSAVAGCAAFSDDEAASGTTADEATLTSSTVGSTTPRTSNTEVSSDPTLSMGETATSADGVSVTISDPRVRKIIFTPDEGVSTHSYPAGTAETQFLVVSVSSQDTDITSLSLTPVLDGNPQQSPIYRHGFNPASSGLLSFQLRIERTESAAIEWRPSSNEQYRWALPYSAVAAIGSAPRFDVEAFTVPDTVTRDDHFTASLTVSNKGERMGRFLAVVLTEGASSVPLVEKFTVPVSAGETVTQDLTGRRVEVEDSSATAILDWGIAEQRASFSVTE